MARIKTIEDVDLKGKRVFVRVDFNVPFDEKGNISDDTRINAALPTIKHLIHQGARIILASHLGRPKGKVNTKYSLAPVAALLSSKLGTDVTMLKDCVGDEVKRHAESMNNGELCLLENLRFHAEEESNDPRFGQALAQFADAYVNDAFGTAHRAHASTVGITQYLSTKVAGFLITQELQFLGNKTATPERPFTVIIGGAKVSDKINVIDVLLEKADTMIIGGAMAYTFALAQGKTVGNSLVEAEKAHLAEKALKKAQERNVKLLLPLDTVITDKLDLDNKQVGETQVVDDNIPEGWQGVDIGPKSIKAFEAALLTSKTILWNGPMGVFEIPATAKGTFAIAQAVADSGAISIIGGGDSVKAVKQSGSAGKVSFISTGGGASLEFLEGKELPGIAALETI